MGNNGWHERELTDAELADDEQYNKDMDAAVRRTPLATRVIARLDDATLKQRELDAIAARDVILWEFKAFQECPKCLFDDFHRIGVMLNHGYHERICNNCGHIWRQR